MSQTFTSTDVVSTANVFSDNQSQRINENTLRSTFSGSTQPSDPVVGQQWYDTANSKTMQYNGDTWVPIDTNGTTQVDVSNAKGSLTSLTSYLRVAHNDDGTLKSSPATAIDEFKDNALIITYLSPTSFTVPSDLTSIFTANRKVKVYLSASTAISYVTSSTFSTVTTVTLGTPVLDATVTAVKYSIIQEGMPQDYNLGLEESTGYGVISGYSASVSSGVVTVTAGVAHMSNGSRYSTGVATFTPVADTTNPRCDLIYLSSAGVVSYLKGTAAATPTVPSVPAGGLALHQALVGIDGTITLTDLRVFKARYQNINMVSITDFGAIGDGVTDNTKCIQSAINSSHTIYVPHGIFYIASSLYGLSEITIIGPGTIKGPTIAAQGNSSVAFYFSGTLGATVSYSSTIPIGTRSFTVNNNFSAGDMVILSNYPTDATDAYTLNSDGTRSYADSSSSNKRQTRRKEICIVKSATTSGFVLQCGVYFAYTDTTQLQFQKVNPIENINIDCQLENMSLQLYLCRNTVITSRMLSTGIAVKTCFGTIIDTPVFDARGTDCRVDCFESSRSIDISGNYRGMDSPADNGNIKLNQILDARLNVSTSGKSDYGWGVMIDTNYAENPTGFTDVPSANISICINADSNAYGVFAAGTPLLAPVCNLSIRGTSRLTDYYLKGVKDAVIDIVAPDGLLRVEGSERVIIKGRYDSFFSNRLIDQRSGEYQNNVDVDFAGVSFAPSATSSVPAFSCFENPSFSEILVDDSKNPTPYALCTFNGCDNIYFGNFRAKYRSVANSYGPIQTLVLHAVTSPTGTLTVAGNLQNAFGGAPWPVPQTIVGQLISSVSPTWESPLKLGGVCIWRQGSTGYLRFKNGTPTSDTDGAQLSVGAS